MRDQKESQTLKTVLAEEEERAVKKAMVIVMKVFILVKNLYACTAFNPYNQETLEVGRDLLRSPSLDCHPLICLMITEF